MNALVVYDSQYGNTEHIARTIAGALREFGEARIVHVGSARTAGLQGVDLLVVDFLWSCSCTLWPKERPAEAPRGGGGS